MKRLVIFACSLLPCAALAEEPPTMVLMPKALADAAIALIERDPAVQIRDSLLACAAANSAHPPPRDNCPTVTAALKAQRDALAEARKTPKPAETSPPAAQ